MRIAVVAGFGLLVLVPSVRAAELALKQVMLSSAGVGYFEYEAAVTGPAPLTLSVKLDEVDDLLKSLVVYDSVGGVGAVTLPGRDARTSAFGAVPFGPEALQSPLAFLNALQGVELAVAGPRPMQGRLLRAESVREPGRTGEEGRVLTRVSLLTAAGLQQFVLEDAESVQVADPGLRERIGRALATTRRESAADSRLVTVASVGSGARVVRVAYVAAAPLWKASYRLVLPEADAGADATARLQGWATLENESGSDWQGATVRLQYGNPVTFHQSIYRAYYVTRPEVPVEVLGRLLPDVDTRARPVGGAPVGASAGAPMPAPMAAARAMAPAAAPPMAEAGEPAVTQEAATQTMFTIASAIDLPSGYSAAVPILDERLPARRVALARPGAAHPLAAVQLRNATPSSLPAGVLTLYDPAADAPYAGDARLGGLPAGESRLLAYAQDLRTNLAWSSRTQDGVAALSAADGVLRVLRRQRRVTTVVITAPEREARRVLIEAPKAAGEAVAPGFAQPSETTATAWRFAVELQPGTVQTVRYAVDRGEQETISLTDDPEAVLAVIGLEGVSPAAKAALERLAGLRQAATMRAAERDRLVARKAALEADEARVRANLSALTPGDALRTRLLQQLDGDETRLGQVGGAIEAAEAAVATAERALDDGIAALRI